MQRRSTPEGRTPADRRGALEALSHSRAAVTVPADPVLVADVLSAPAAASAGEESVSRTRTPIEDDAV